MNLKLQQITIENFKGLQRFAAAFDGDNARLRAANGVGKTSVYDAFSWLLFGKDSAGRTDSGKGAFAIHPQDTHNEPIKGLVTRVEVLLRCDTQQHRFRKEQHERIVKDQFKGYETLCWIDDVPKKVSDFQEVINAMVPEETFKMLTDLAYFNWKLHWTQRRKMLLTLAGQVATPKGFESLLTELNGRSIDDYKKVLKDRKERHEKEQSEINPRLDETRGRLNAYTKQDASELQSQRQAVTRTIAEIDAERRNLLGSEKTRQGKIDAVNQLTAQRLHRESQIKSKMRETKALLEEKGELDRTLAEQRRELTILDGKHKILGVEIESMQATLTARRNRMGDYRDTIKNLQEPNQDDTICFNCKQPLPVAMQETYKADRKKLLDENRQTAKELQREIEGIIEKIATKQKERLDLHAAWERQFKAIEQAEISAKKRMAEIDAALAHPPEPDYSRDAEWQKLTKQIEQGKAQIGEPVAEQIDALENRRAMAQLELDKLNQALAHADQAVQDKARIKQLEAKEQDLTQAIADINKQLAEIGRYRVAVSDNIQRAVNDKFKYVKFKLFDFRLNGSVDETCVATMHGVEYADLSTGEQIRVGVDIANVLSEHSGVSVPLWIDHAESLTLPLEATSQTIQLIATLKFVCSECGQVSYSPTPLKECEHCHSGQVKEEKSLDVEVETGKEAVAA